MAIFKIFKAEPHLLHYILLRPFVIVSSQRVYFACFSIWILFSFFLGFSKAFCLNSKAGQSETSFCVLRMITNNPIDVWPSEKTSAYFFDHLLCIRELLTIIQKGCREEKFTKIKFSNKACFLKAKICLYWFWFLALEFWRITISASIETEGKHEKIRSKKEKTKIIPELKWIGEGITKKKPYFSKFQYFLKLFDSLNRRMSKYLFEAIGFKFSTQKSTDWEKGLKLSPF